MSKAKSETPLMQQHNAIKAKYPDAILLFRVGDFYETFGQDAVIASQVLGITLTKRNNGDENSSQLAGFPHHSLDTYLHKLVKAGYRVAICDQLEDPKQAKGIVKRGVTELVTPGVATNDKLLDHANNNFLAAMYFENNQAGISFLDISTGEFYAAEGSLDYADKLLQSLQPAEVIFMRSKQKFFKENFGYQFITYALDEWIFTKPYSEEMLLKHFGTHSLKGFGIEEMNLGIIAAGAVLHYLKDTEHPNLQHINTIQRISQNDHLWMDKFTIRNLELMNVGEGDSLFKTLNHTTTPMGARMLRRWMLMPLLDLKKIQERLDAVEFLIKDVDLKNKLIQLLNEIGDIERLVSKIPARKINPREVKQLSKGLQNTFSIKEILSQTNNDFLLRLADGLNPCSIIREKIEKTIHENPPAIAAKGAVIADGVNEDLDEYRKIAKGGKEYLLELQQKEIQLTGISSLKIGFNNVFGYYLEVTNLHKEKVPESWIRKQTLANAERYITPELKSFEEKIVGAEDKIFALENQLYQELLNELQEFIAQLQSNASIIGTLDVLSCFAQTAISNHYCKPNVHNGLELKLNDSRHPVIEKKLPPGEQYISNNIFLDNETQQVIILTGPNMSGKSALLRQSALITLMAHIGSFVPASSASIPLTDKIFTRVGASDNLSGGESTFMVEMNETASIINNISERSLIILDEIGRGTSTYDGISIAWSIAEYLHNSPEHPKTLFATHYHELNELESRAERIKNYHISHRESGNKIIFLRKLELGGSKHSFGIHVAKLAGMPNELINRANEILHQLESARDNQGANVQKTLNQISTPKMQLNIFDVHSMTFEEIRSLLENIDINRLTPVEALLKLQEIKNKIN